MFQYIYLVGIDNLSDIVRYDDDGSSTLDGIYAGLNLFGSNGIKAGSRLIKEYNRWVLDKHAGYGNTLLLAAT